MPKDVNVLLIEDDPYARDLMSMLLTRDWRTRIMGEAGSQQDTEEILKIPFQKIDAIVLDMEHPGDPEWPFRLAEIARKVDTPPRILCTATRADETTLKRILEAGFGGYVIKREIGYALAAAVATAAKQPRWVTTPEVYSLSLRARTQLPDNTIIMEETEPTGTLTPREVEIARLAILFNHPHRDLADELLIRADQVSKHVSSVYQKLGLDEILNGEIEPEAFFEDKMVLKHFQRIMEKVSAQTSKRKTADMATLAFHLLTTPKNRPL